MLKIIKYPKGIDREAFIECVRSDPTKSILSVRGIPIVGHNAIYEYNELNIINGFPTAFTDPDRYIGYVKEIIFDPIPPYKDYLEYEFLDTSMGKFARAVVVDPDTEYSISPFCIVNPETGSLRILGFPIYFKWGNNNA